MCDQVGGGGAKVDGVRDRHITEYTSVSYIAEYTLAYEVKKDSEDLAEVGGGGANVDGGPVSRVGTVSRSGPV